MSPAQRIDLGLAVLATLPPPPGGWTSRDIADVCGVHHSAVLYHERRALAKMRARAQAVEHQARARMAARVSG